MLGALISVGGRVWATSSRQAFFRRWRNYVIVAGVALLCVLSALFVDKEMYWTAGIMGACAIAALIALVVQLVKASLHKAERKRRLLEEAAQHAAKVKARMARRAAAAEARAEKIEKVRTSATETAIGLGSTAAGLANATKSGAASLADFTKSGAAGLADATKIGATTLAGATKSGATSVADATRKGFTGARDRLSAWRNKPGAG